MMSDSARILQARAHALAKPLVSNVAAKDLFMIFEMGGESYALDINFTFQVTSTAQFSVLPGAQPPLSGLTLWRGEMLPVLDIGGAASGGTVGQSLVIVGQERPAFALPVATVAGIRPLDAARLHTARDQSGREYVSGITDDAVVVLDGQRLLQRYS